jgi:hypothetical protein
MESHTVFVICLVVGVVVILFFLTKARPNSESPQSLLIEEDHEPELTTKFYVGKYLSGFPDFTGVAELVFCGVTEDDFVFRKGMKGTKIGRIPRKEIKNISLSKEGKNSCISVRWDNGLNLTHDSVFTFVHKKSESDAVAASENLKAWIKGGTEETAV